MFVPPDGDSDTCYFLLTPVRIGPLRVLIELRWEEALRGSRRLRTECVATAENIPVRTGMSVVQMKLGAGLEKGDVNPRPVAPSDPRPGAPTAVLEPEDQGFFPQPQNRAEADRAREAERERVVGDHARWKDVDRERASAYRYESPATATSYEVRRSAARRGWLTPAILIAIIGAISSITVGYLQFGRKPAASHTEQAASDIPLRWQIINSKTLEAVPDARVTISFDSGAAPSEGVTDHAGTYSIKVNRSSIGVAGKVIVHADGFKPYSRDFAVSSNNGNERLWLDPVSESAPTKNNSEPISTSSVIAGRVIDSENKSAIGHALVTLSGRPESALTDDSGNYRILVKPTVAHQTFRLQVEKAGCTPVDRNVRPPEENLILELSCGVK
jgi:hypothetical protein